MKTVSLELAKQLKEAGYPQEGYFFWWVNVTDKSQNPILAHFQGTQSNEDYLNEHEDKYEFFAAPTADEILDRLPKKITVSEMDYFLDVYHEEDVLDEWVVAYNYIRHNLGFKSHHREMEETIADAAAKMWLYLKKEKLI